MVRKPNRMTSFRTEIQVQASPHLLNYHTPMLFIGSCFTDNIGGQLQQLKFPVEINPFGVIYNPVSVANSLTFLLQKAQFSKIDLQYANDQWFSFYHHSRFSHADANVSLQRINQALQKGSEQIYRAHTVFITLGTAWVYEHKKSGIVVSNNHKLPANQFKRYRLSPDDVVKQLGNILEKVKAANPKVQVVFTVSPIRHWKDGAVENQLSKAALLVAVHELVKQFPQVSYFPAYEIMMDDLRDYRFYAADMLHLSEPAIAYIWDKFRLVYLQPAAQRVMKRVAKINKALHHRAFEPEHPRHQAFLHDLRERILQLMKEFPELPFQKELEQIDAQLTH